MKILVTGANGFLGSNLTQYLSEKGCTGVAFARKEMECPNGFHYQKMSRLDKDIKIQDQLSPGDVLVHCAGISASPDASAETVEFFNQVNVESTIAIAEQSIEAQLKSFVFISSLKVNGEASQGRGFQAKDTPNPSDIYAKSKTKAEEKLLELFQGTKTQLIIIRPPMIYGPGGKGNFNQLVKWVNDSKPLPFGCVKNNFRSTIYVENLCDFIHFAITGQDKLPTINLVADERDLSTHQMIVEIGKALDKKPKLIPIPSWCFKLLTTILRKPGIYQRIFGSLQIDKSELNLLSWRAPFGVEPSFQRTIKHYLEHQND